jgi:hypothetical protein
MSDLANRPQEALLYPYREDPQHSRLGKPVFRPFVQVSLVALRLHPHDGEIHERREWMAQVGFVESWHS